MMRSMYAGVTGLRNHQIRMDSIGNNIANVNTVGYKASRVTFQDTLNQTLRGASAPNGNRGGINSVQVGLGMNLASIDVLHTQGNLQNTGRVTDLAIQGDGFFIVSDGHRQYYTRAGNFNLERDGRLVNASNGMIVRGWLADNLGNINTNAPLQNIWIPVGRTIAPIATTEITYTGNLDKNLDGLLKYTALSVSSPTGESCTVEFELEPIGFNEYRFTVTTANPDVSITIAPNPGTITLNADGSVNTCNPASFSVNFLSSAEAVQVTCPLVGDPDGGVFRTYKPVSESYIFESFDPTDPGGPPYTSGTITILDDTGQPCEVELVISDPGTSGTVWPAAGTYDWQINAVGGTVITGGSGSFIWDGTQITASTGSAVIQQPGGLRITIDGLANGTIPALRVTSKEGDFTGSFKASESMVTITRVFDSLGTNHNLTTTLTKTGVNEWDWVCRDDGGNVVGNGHLVYSTVGELISSTGTNIAFNPPGARPVVIVPDFSSVTQYAGGLLDPQDVNYDPTVAMTEVNSPFQDGYPMGELQSIDIDQSGIIIGVFSNGMNQNLGQLAVANFTNPGGLVRSGDTLFEESSNSGTPQIGIAGRGGRGQVTPGAIEMANVDLAQEFTDMIVTERGFQSNSRVITTSDEMLQELVNLKR